MNIKHLELFEKLLFRSRIIITLGLLVNLFLGIMLIFIASREFFFLLKNLFVYSVSQIVAQTVTILDLILLAVVMFIFSFSLYEIFIKKIDPNNSRFKKIPSALVVRNLDHLKEKLGKVILLILIITFFKYVVNYNFQTILELLYFSVSIFFISLSLYFTKNFQRK